MDIKKIIENLCNTDGISGFEKNACAVTEQTLAPYCDKVETDNFGNVFGFISCGDDSAPTLLLDAHIDQIGFIVTDVLDGGFLRFAPIGGIDFRMLLGCELRILSETECFGIVSCLPPHLIKASEADKSIPLSEMVIDTGLLDAKSKIKIGTPIVFNENIMFMSDNTATGKCLDDRAGVAAIVHALDMIHGKSRNVNIVVLASACEETGLMGAIIGGYKIKPDYCIAVDVTHAKTPDAPASKTFDFGGGVFIGMGPNLDRKLTNKLISIAKAEEISYGVEVMEGHTGTNAWAFQVSREGIPTALLSIPLKYMHTPIETVSLKDMKNVSKLIAEYILNANGGADNA